MGVATRVNGAAPPFVPLDEIDLASWDFWAHDDDYRDGAFATLRREAPIALHRVAPQNISGTRKTVEGGTVTVTGASDALKADDASVARTRRAPHY